MAPVAKTVESFFDGAVVVATNNQPVGWRGLHSLKLTWHLKITSWKRRLLLETIIFRGELLVSGSVRLTITIKPLKIGNPKGHFIFQPSIFRGKLLVSGRV